MQDLFDALAKIAAPVTTHFKSDFEVHDAKVILALQPGDVILWTPHASGSHLIVLERGWRPNACAKEHFDAVGSTYGANLPWHVVQVMHARRWRLKKVRDARAYVETVADRVIRQTRAAGSSAEVVRELHL